METLDRIHFHLDAVRDVLVDRTRRNHYNRQIGISTPSLESRVTEVAEARALWRSGVELLGSRKPADALAQFEEAARQDPHEPEFKVFQAWAILAMPPSVDHLQRARTLVEEALKELPDMVEGLVCQASIDRMEGRVEEARGLIRRALMLDPDHAEAKAVKDLLRARPGAPKMGFQKSPSSLLDRVLGLFKKGS
jgi:tetratricopeptide (TPR) repeat protein